MNSKVIRGKDIEKVNADWGSLQWLAGKNAPEYGMTFGKVTFKPGKENPAHLHPECDEILFVVSGEIEHTLPEGGTTVLNSGDCILLPRGKFHKAKNVGKDEAVAIVTFNSAERSVVAEDSGGEA